MLREFQGISEEIPHKIIEWANCANKRLDQSLALQEQQLKADFALRQQTQEKDYEIQKSLVQIEQNNFKLAVIGFVCTFFLASAFLVLSFCLLYHGETASALIAALPSMAIILTSVFKNLKR